MNDITIPLRSHEESILVLGPYDRHAKLMRQALEIEIYTSGGNLKLKGALPAVEEARGRIEHLLGKMRKGREIALPDAEQILMGKPQSSRAGLGTARHDADAGHGSNHTASRPGRPARVGQFRVRAFEPRTENQRRYLEHIKHNDLTFGVGAAGTGKTYLAVASALASLRAGACRRLIISRPVVEAGEKLGFLPGDLQAKLNPYMRPVYDALGDLLEFEDVMSLEEAGVIEVAPLAYMRGRTLSSAVVILDEAQNTTVGQMKMFLTRLGEGSKMIVTGDPTQTDLEGGQKSGLVDAMQRLQGFEGIGMIEFGTADICRHALVQQIVRAYEAPNRADR